MPTTPLRGFDVVDSLLLSGLASFVMSRAPQTVTTDQGSQFEEHLFKATTHLIACNRTRTTAATCHFESSLHMSRQGLDTESEYDPFRCLRRTYNPRRSD